MLILPHQGQLICLEKYQDYIFIRGNFPPQHPLHHGHVSRNNISQIIDSILRKKHLFTLTVPS